MANFACEFYSNTLDYRASFNVMIPEQCTEDIPVVFLLHGLGGNQNDWQRLTSVDRYAKEQGIALVLPYGASSFYCDMKHGEAYHTYIAKELLSYTRTIFPISRKREKTFIAGMSMGGYGALKLALTEKETYGACAAFAGTMNIQQSFLREDRREIGKAIWGAEEIDRLAGSRHDVLTLARQRQTRGETDLWIYHGCGTEDTLYPQNLELRDLLLASSFPYEYHERPGGHTWDVWDYYGAQAMEFFARYLQAHTT